MTHAIVNLLRRRRKRATERPDWPREPRCDEDRPVSGQNQL